MNIYTYEEYSSTEKALTITQMEDIHKCIIKSIQGDQDAIEIYEDLVSASIKYSEIRSEWTLMPRDQKIDKDPLRTALHNDVIIQVNMLARYLTQIGRPSSWRSLLGDEEKDRVYSVGGKMILPPHGKEFFTRRGKQFFTLPGKEFFTSSGKQFFTLPGSHFFTSFGKQFFTF